MPVQPLEEIEVHKLAEPIADKWWEIISRWKPFAQDTVGKQLIRAVDSIGANIAESYGRYHYGEKINHLYYARGSLYEAKFFARRAKQRNLVTEAQFNEMMNDLQTLAPKLNAYINSKKGQRANA
ncbi:MAG: four helix bundle protein [Chloroflexi bacterium]|nr:four helix bundle protein [Chloroflexota bacterium]